MQIDEIVGLINKVSVLKRILEMVRDHLIPEGLSIKGPISVFDPLMEASIEILSLLAESVSRGVPRVQLNKVLEFREELYSLGESAGPIKELADPEFNRKYRDNLYNPLGKIEYVPKLPKVISEPLGDFLWDVVHYLLDFKAKLPNPGFHDQFKKSMLPEIPELDLTKSSQKSQKADTIGKHQEIKRKVNSRQARHFIYLRRAEAKRRKSSRTFNPK